MSGGLSRATEIGVERLPTRRRPHLRDRRREPSRGPHRGRAADSWRLGELGARFRDAPNGPESRATSQGRILIVDDENAIRLVCRVNLRSAGFETLEAADGETALALARAERPDLILLDIMLPGVDGWEVAAELASMPETREIPIVFLTARTTAMDESRGHAVGGVGYIAKPFDPTRLSEMLTTVLERLRRGERESMRREWERSIGSDQSQL
jgi:CheY-like chemotaxis protein